ncbi:MAG: metal-dependent transcriptional regulator [Bacteroidales bacterium]|nr:metal-dependent transcriptional regulator [Bacteroidales bacterium]
MSVSTEDFLKGIYQLKYDYHGKASSSNLSVRLNISRSAVTDMAKKLAGKGLIEYRKYKEISLTNEGSKLALSIIRRHRLWESFLSKVLNLELNEIHREAEMLEHQTSEKLVSKIDEYLGYPQFDPHGDPIPDANGNLPAQEIIPLQSAETNKQYIIARIHIKSDELYEFFIANGITLEKLIIVDKYLITEKLTSVKIDEKKIVLNEQFADCIFIKEIK